ncbi:hypothetical protein R3W88_022816 [Solanum pinnatisectum]|uniref:Uncharacterized protein n=1 Tax=Solanum pinnatisectum TaxID=50273 RepID=A0AAV9LWI5_9SOLN|nr:hypothetical protein R3W88_022816 [Solanum pinnatisectum]
MKRKSGGGGRGKCREEEITQGIASSSSAGTSQTERRKITEPQLKTPEGVSIETGKEKVTSNRDEHWPKLAKESGSRAGQAKTPVGINGTLELNGVATATPWANLFATNRLETKGGREYTWTNRRVYSRIDKAIDNTAWIDIMPTQVMAMKPLFSNHSPLGLIVEDQRDTQKRSFRFFNCGLKGIRKNLKVVRREMQKLNTKEFKGVADRVQRIRRELMLMQNNMRVVTMHQTMIEEEKILRT